MLGGGDHFCAVALLVGGHPLSCQPAELQPLSSLL